MTEYNQTLNLLIKNATKVNRRNKSLLMRKTRRTKDFDLATASSSVKQIQKTLYQFKPGQHSIIKSTFGDTEEEKNSYKLNKIRRKSNLIREETGTSPLAIGYPFFSGFLSDWYRGPLVLIPVELKLDQQSNQPSKWVFEIDEDAEVSINLALLISLQQELGIEFDPDGVPQWEAKEVQENPAEFWQEVRDYFPDDLIKGWSVLEEEIEELPEVSRDETPERSEQGGKFELKPYAVLGHFPQGKNPLVNDLIKLKDDLAQGELSNLIEHLLGSNSDDTVKEVIEEEVANIDDFSAKDRLKVMPADATQEEALLQSQKAKSLVIQGPPGTGKSQTIVNLIGDSLYHDEQVLLVCEKRVALEVVDKMLQNLGLDFLTVLVGGRGSKQHQARNHVYNTLRQVAQSRKDGERVSLQRYNSKVDRSVKELNKLHEVLNQPVVDDAPELSLQQLYKEVEPLDREIREELSSISEVDSLEILEQRLDTIEHYLDLNSDVKNDSMWKKRSAGVLATEKFSEEKLFEITDTLQEMKTIAPLQRALEEQDYKQALRVKSGEDYIDQESLEIIVDKQDSKLRFLSPQWIQAKFKLLIDHRHLKEEAQQITEEIKQLKQWFDREYIANNLESTKDESEIVAFAQQLEDDWQRDKHILNRLDKIYKEQSSDFAADLYQLQELATQNDLEVVDIYERAVKTSWLEEKQREHPELNWFMNNKYQELQEQLEENLTTKISKGSQYLKRKYKQRQKEILNSSQGQRIIKISNRQRKLPSLRKFLADYGEIIRNILPVWLASPDQVAKLFSLEDKFDHVIFDEASQIPLEDALPALARGERITVVGDKKQMPPNRLFQRTLNREESDNLAEDEQTSLLDAAADVWPDKMLKYHYRSQHPELIEFSNQAFYNGQLKIAPNNHLHQNDYRAVQWQQVDGSWEDRTNPEEAAKVIEYLLEELPTAQQEVDKTLYGIVAFNQSQAEKLFDTLQQTLEDKRREKKELTKAEKDIWEWCMGSKVSNSYVWIKNLENVQGDEVKHLLMSVGYAVDPEMGRVPNRFGLLNQEGGEKRLNVAITRAQESITVFCSFDPDYDLEVSGSKNRGPELFKQYLRFVKYVSEGQEEEVDAILENINPSRKLDDGDVSYYDYDSPFEEEVAEALRKRGYEIHTQVGSYGYRIDLGVVDPENKARYIIGIECDGAAYHRSKSARERDVYRQLFLEEKGWQIERIWSRRWWEKKEQVLDELEEKIEKAVTKTEEQATEKVASEQSQKEEVDYLMEDIEYNERFKELTRRILKHLINTKDKFSNKELQQELNYKDTDGIRKALKPLREQDIVEKEGRGPGTRYKINHRLSIFESKQWA